MRNLPKTYKDLLFWKSAFETSLMVSKLARSLPRDFLTRIIISQVLRSAMLIGANIAEGYGRYGPKEFSRFLQVALGSANETDYWLSLLRECYPKYSSEIDLIIAKNTETIKMLAGSIKTIRDKKAK